ncbi:MAG: DUF6232 family protein [Chloroflexi bacterium]|nr:DUF6232 family protein [Chloroflexota bacterium]
MADERVFYSDANHIRVGTREAVFGNHKYGTRNIESVGIATQERRIWPGVMAFIAAGILITLGYVTNSTQWIFMGAASFTGGTFFFRRRKITYGVRIVTNKGPVLVLASKQKPYVDDVKLAIERAIEATRAEAVVD